MDGQFEEHDDEESIEEKTLEDYRKLMDGDDYRSVGVADLGLNGEPDKPYGYENESGKVNLFE